MEEKKMDKKDDGSGGEIVLGEDDDQDVVFPGFRFHPTDEELVAFYLRRKVEKKALSIEIIKQIDIYKYDPWDLPKASHFGGEREWYFFCLRGRKYRNSIRPNRVTESGFWKATGIDRPIYSSTSSAGAGAGDCIGLKKSLVHYRGSAGKGTKTDWMMHEFRLPSSEKDTNAPPSIQEAEIWTICRIFKRNITSYSKKYVQQHHLKESMISKRSRFEYTTCSSASISSSFESDAREECKYSSPFVTSKYSNVTAPACTTYCVVDERNQALFLDFNVPTAQTPCNNNNNLNELSFKDGNWDELGRIMELTTDTSAVNL